MLLQREPEALTVHGVLTPGRYTLCGNVSSQFVSGLLMALPLLSGESVVEVLPPVESRAYIDITLDCMRRFGVTAEETERNTFRVPGRQAYRPADVTVEGDWSNAAALYAFNALDGSVSVTGLNDDSLQGDRACLALLNRLSEPGAEIDLSDGELQEENLRLREENAAYAERVKTLESENAALSEKSDFIDNHVVFIENDGTRYYHSYSCPRFKKQSYWAYSTNIAVSRGYEPCPDCQ